METTYPIEDVPLGTRISAQNPRREDYDFSLPEPAEESWRLVRLEVRKNSGTQLDLELLRPAEWVEAQELFVGRVLETAVPELELHAYGIVTAIEPCPPLAPAKVHWSLVASSRATSRSEQLWDRHHCREALELASGGASPPAEPRPLSLGVPATARQQSILPAPRLRGTCLGPRCSHYHEYSPDWARTSNGFDAPPLSESPGLSQSSRVY